MKPLAILIALFVYSAKAQVDSLEKILPLQSGKAKILTLSELCYQLSIVNIEKSIYYGRLGFELAKKSNDSLLLAAAANDLSLPYLYKGEFDSCIQMSMLAYGIRQRKGEITQAANSYSKAALAYYEKGDLKTAISINMVVEKIYLDNKLELQAAKIQNNIGSIFEKNQQVSEAAIWYTKSMKICKQFKSWESYITAAGNLGIAKRKLGHLHEAEKILLELLPLAEKEARKEVLSQLYQSLGVLYREKNDIQKGLSYYLRAREIYASIGTNIGISSIDANIGNCYRDLGDFNKAEEYLRRSYELAKKTRSWSYLKTPLEGLYELETKKNNLKKANEYLNELVIVKDSIYSEETKNTLGTLQVKYKTAEKDKQLLSSSLEQIRLKDSVRKRNYAILISCIVFLSLISLFVYFNQRNKQKLQVLHIQNLQNLQKERERISRDLHDNMGAEMTMISSQLDAKAYVAEEKEKLELKSIADISRRAMEQLRETIWTLNDEELTWEKLSLRVKKFAEKLLEKTPVEFLINSQINSQSQFISAEKALHLYRMIQEAINNSVKHSQCSQINITFFQLDKQVTILIADNGLGFIVEQAPNGNGLKNILYRAKEIDAKLKIENSNGTKIEITVST